LIHLELQRIKSINCVIITSSVVPAGLPDVEAAEGSVAGRHQKFRSNLEGLLLEGREHLQDYV
jgi:hypothetical protein